MNCKWGMRSFCGGRVLGGCTGMSGDTHKHERPLSSPEAVPPGDPQAPVSATGTVGPGMALEGPLGWLSSAPPPTPPGPPPCTERQPLTLEWPESRESSWRSGTVGAAGGQSSAAGLDMVVLSEDMPESGCLVSRSADGSRTVHVAPHSEWERRGQGQSRPKDCYTLGQGSCRVTSVKPLAFLGSPSSS